MDLITILNQYSNQQLLMATQNCVKKEKEMTTIVLKHLLVLDSRKLWADAGSSSLFSYCTDILGYTRAETYIRICAMKLMRESKGAEEKMEKGTLSLTNAQELYKRIRQHEEEKGEKISMATKEDLMNKIEGLSTRAAEEVLKQEFSPATPSKKKVILNLDEDTFRMLQKIKHKLGISTEEQLLQKLLEEKEKDLNLREQKNAERDEMKKGEVKEEIKETKDQPLQRSRYVPRKVRAEVLREADYQCQFVSPISGQRCQERRHLQFEHCRPFSWGGESTVENGRIYYFGHNQRAAVKAFGQTKMEFFWKAKSRAP